MLDTIFLLFCLILIIFLQVFIHEAGHLVFGMLTGYDYISFRIFNIMIYKQNGTLHLGKAILSGTGGQCILTPSFEESDDIPFFWYNAGGIVANLITTFVMFGIVFLFPENSIGRAISVFSATIGALFAFYNGIPMKTRLIANDGYNILKMTNDPQAKRAFWRMFKINELYTKGMKLSDCPNEWFEPLRDDCNNPLICGFNIYILLRYLEKHDFENALEICEKIIESQNALGLYRNEAICEKQFCEIMLNLQGSKIEVTNALTKSNVKERLNSVIRFHTLYAYEAFVKNDLKQANHILNDFEQEYSKNSNKGLLNLENELLTNLKIMAYDNKKYKAGGSM